MPVATLTPAPARKFSRNPLFAFYQSSIGKKWVVGATGVILFAYVIGHLIGNLQVFLGPDRINVYAQFLHDLGPLLWMIRAFLLLAFIIHIVATIELAQQNKAARPQAYAVQGYQRSTLTSRTMVVSGLIVLCFVIYHLLHFTFEATNPIFRTLEDSHGRHDVYRMLILAFRKPLISFFYILSMFLLTCHLSHGFASVVQTFGLNNSKLSGLIARSGESLAWLIFIGYISIPTFILLRIVH